MDDNAKKDALLSVMQPARAVLPKLNRPKLELSGTDIRKVRKRAKNAILSPENRSGRTRRNRRPSISPPKTSGACACSLLRRVGASTTTMLKQSTTFSRSTPTVCRNCDRVSRCQGNRFAAR
jgi:hypothetical protein